ncbi:MAG: DUF3618 domain-containing protein [Rhodococcus sp.]|nr:DUF3618 domain-containing protein [Rhodococcus sp. (in: high G+C Gram-positive bacteria)]
MTDSPAHSVSGNSDQPPSIEEQRSELADTVAALAAKADYPHPSGQRGLSTGDACLRCGAQ